MMQRVRRDIYNQLGRKVITLVWHNYSRLGAGAVQSAVQDVPLAEALAAAHGMMAPLFSAQQIACDVSDLARISSCRRNGNAKQNVEVARPAPAATVMASAERIRRLSENSTGDSHSEVAVMGPTKHLAVPEG